MLDAINKITIDVSDPLNTSVIKAVQADIRSRFVEITLVSNGEPLSIPAGSDGMVGIRRPNGTYVLYDQTEDETPAVTFTGNVATVYLTQEALAVAGALYTSVSIYTSTARLTAFHFMVDVEPTAVPSDVVVESDYFNILEGLVADAIDAADRAEQAAATVGNPVGYDPQTPSTAEQAQARQNIGIVSASTSAEGIVMLYDGIDSTSVNKAPTANAMRMVEPKKKTFANTTVSTASFAADATYTAYPYRAAVTLTGVTASMLPEVVFDAEDAASGNYAPVATAYSGGVYIYSVAVPDSSVTIPSIVAWEGV